MQRCLPRLFRPLSSPSAVAAVRTAGAAAFARPAAPFPMLRAATPTAATVPPACALAHAARLYSSRPPAATAATTAITMPPATAATATAGSQVMAPTQPLLMRAGGAGRGPSANDDYLRPQHQPAYYDNNNNNNGGGGGDDALTPYVRQHLTRVYGLLACGVAAAGGGAALMIMTSLAKVIPFWLPMVGGFISLLWLSFAPPANPSLKLGLFFAFTVLEGMGLAPLILMTSMKGVLVTSLVLTGAVFSGFTAAAFLAPRASLVVWQGPLFGCLLGLMGVSLINIFWPSAIAHSLILYGGLALFSVMVAVDTQAMVERARCGVGDHVHDALEMFLNVLNIFVHIAQIMSGQD